MPTKPRATGELTGSSERESEYASEGFVPDDSIRTPMRLLIIGVGDAFSQFHFGSSGLIEGPGGYVLIDCPDLVHRAIREASQQAGWSVDASSIHDLVITHLHGDHSNGLESLGFARMLRRFRVPSEPLPRLHINEPASKRVWEKLAPAMDRTCLPHPPQIGNFFEVHTIDPTGESIIAGLSVRCRFTHHPVPTTGLLISDGTWTLGWSGDTSFEPAHIDWLNQADLIVHESNLGPVHTPIQALNALSSDVRAKMRLIHLTDDFDQSSTDIQILSEGDVLERPEISKTISLN